jgi:hypothetical protein
MPLIRSAFGGDDNATEFFWTKPRVAIVASLTLDLIKSSSVDSSNVFIRQGSYPEMSGNIILIFQVIPEFIWGAKHTGLKLVSLAKHHF